MQLAHSLTRISALAIGIAGALACGQVHAAAFQLKENSVKAQGRAMAGAASAKGDASVVANNPAMMSTFDRATIQGDVTAIDLSFEFEGSGYAALDADHLDRLLRRRKVMIDAQDLRALAREGQRGGAAVAHAFAGTLAGSDDDCDAIFQAHVI